MTFRLFSGSMSHGMNMTSVFFQEKYGRIDGKNFQTKSCSAHNRFFHSEWLKTDFIFKTMDDFQIKIKELKKSLYLNFEKIIFDTRSCHNHEKKNYFFKSPIVLLIPRLLKQAPLFMSYPSLLKNVGSMHELHHGIADNVQITGAQISMMHCISASDLLISDESSLLNDAVFAKSNALKVKDQHLSHLGTRSS
jgi:hypothetical protein